jgi:hypothetical protein
MKPLPTGEAADKARWSARENMLCWRLAHNG